MKKVLAIFVCLLCCLQSFTEEIAGPDLEAEDYIVASLAITDPGTRFFSTIGHACLHMRCDYYNKDIYYSYECEEINNSNFFTYAAGNANMGMFPLLPEQYLAGYIEQGRGVKEYVLNLTTEQEMELWRILDERVKEGRYLKYDYIKRGCAKVCRECVSEAIRPSKIKYEESVLNKRTTFREEAGKHWWNEWTWFMIMTLGGGKNVDAERKGVETLIVPADLRDAWQNATIDDKPLIKDCHEVLPSIAHYESCWFSPLIACILLLLLAIANIFWKRPYFDWLVLAIITLWGLVFIYLLSYAPLSDTGWNWLIFLFNPLPAIFWKWREKWAVPYAIIMLGWGIGMIFAPHHYADASHLILALAFTIIVLKPNIRKWVKLDKK